MLIKLFHKQASNWILIAEQLKDPLNWDRFVPTHSTDSERAIFDKMVLDTATESIKLKVCKDLLRRGSSAYEYDWNIDEEVILSHAIQVADALGLNLEIGTPSQNAA